MKAESRLKEIEAWTKDDSVLNAIWETVKFVYEKAGFVPAMEKLKKQNTKYQEDYIKTHGEFLQKEIPIEERKFTGFISMVEQLEYWECLKRDECIIEDIKGEANSFKNELERFEFLTNLKTQPFHYMGELRAMKYDEFVKRIDELIEPKDIEPIKETPTFSDNIKLEWTGTQKQLCDLFRQLRIKNLVGNSYADIAMFLKNAFPEKFKNSKLSTIKTVLETNDRPKGRHKQSNDSILDALENKIE